MRRGLQKLYGNLWKYALVAVAAVFIWSAVFSSLDKVKDNERFTLSVYNLDCDTQALRDELVLRLPELTEQQLLEVYVDHMEHTPNQTYASTLLTMQTLQTDLVIMPESLLKELDAAAYFPELPQTLQASCGADAQFYQVEGKNYGILICSQTMENHFTRYCRSDEPCYLLLSETSYNLGAIFDRGEEADDAALAVIGYLLECDET